MRCRRVCQEEDLAVESEVRTTVVISVSASGRLTGRNTPNPRPHRGSRCCGCFSAAGAGGFVRAECEIESLEKSRI